MKFQMGIKAKDAVTGFQGTITGFCSYLTGCDQYLIAPSVDKEGKHVDSRWYDVNRIVPVGIQEPINLDTSVDKGACEPAPGY